jgi:uncharacterized OB-fold protein
MASLPLALQPHTVSVRTKTGSTGTGTKYAAATTVTCRADDQIRLVRNSDGQQVVSSTTIYTSDSRNLWTPGSLVTVNGHETTAISVARHDDADAGAWQHTEIALT